MDKTDHYINIHTHKIQTDNQIAVLNIIVNQDIAVKSILPRQNNRYCSAGVHPWFMDEWKTQIEQLKKIASKPNVIAIGECGLDKKVKTPLTEQIELFSLQIALSELLQKPLIIHCVKAFNELIKIRKTMKSKMPWIVHGFNGNLEISKQCLHAGMILSFGKSLFNSKSSSIQVIKSLTTNSFFLETDESDYSIEEIYDRCSGITGISVEQLKREMAINFNNSFKC